MRASSYILSSMLYKSYAIFVGACEPFWCLSYVRKWDETNPDKMVRCDTWRYLDAQVEEEERTTDGLVDPSFKEAAGRSEIIFS